MAKRIVDYISKNGIHTYFIQTNRIFGFIPYRWHTMDFYDKNRKIAFPLTFNIINEAKKFVDFPYKILVITEDAEVIEEL